LAAGALTVGALALAQPRPDTGATGVVAIVDGEPISRSAVEEYAAAFRDPGGVLVISPREVLISVINQSIVRREAVERGIEVDRAALQALLAEEDGALADVRRAEIARTGGSDALARRLEAFMEMNAVRDAVLRERGHVPRASSVPGDGASLQRQEIWSDWLADRRSCSDLRILDESYGVPSSTPRPDCA
jgi:hypothetical protein